MDGLAAEYEGRADVIAVAWKASLADTSAAARRLLTSGATRWALDEDESVFAAFEVGYQPVSALVHQGVEIGRWHGEVPISEVRALLDEAVRL